MSGQISGLFHSLTGRREFLRRAAMAGCLSLLPDRVLADRVNTPPASEVTTIKFNPGNLRQTIENFGASDSWSIDPIGREWDIANRRKIAELLFDRRTGIGLSCWRFNIGAGSDCADAAAVHDKWRIVPCFRRGPDQPWDWNAQSGQQWFLREAKAAGVEKTLAFTVSPPVWLTRNGHGYCDDDGTSTNLRAGAEGHFAGFIGEVLRHFESEGLPFDFFSPLNEPGWGWVEAGGQEGCRYSDADVVRVLKAMSDEFTRRSIGSVLVSPEAVNLQSLLDDDFYAQWSGRPRSHFSAGNASPENAGRGLYRNYILRLLGDPAISRILNDRIAAHAYGAEESGNLHRLRDLRRVVRANIDRYQPGGKYWMTEFCVMETGRDLGMDTALRVATMMHYDLVDAEASAWHWWLAVSPYDFKDGLIYTDYKTDGSQNIIPSKLLWAFGNFSRFLRPDFRRVETSIRDIPETLLISAWLSPDGRLPVCVIVNNGVLPQKVKLDAGGLVPAFTPHETSAGFNLTGRTSLPAGAICEIAPRSVTTLVGIPG